MNADTLRMTDFTPEVVTPYDPRLEPQDVPVSDVCDFPLVSICVNLAWIPHIDGMIARLLFRDAWKGTNDEIDRGVQGTEKILAMLGNVDYMGCCCGNNGALTRFNAAGELEQSTDGGASWHPFPQGDPRQTATLFPPLPGDDNAEKRCQEAANATDHIKEIADKLIADSALWASITGLLSAILGIVVFLGIIGSGGALTPLLIGLSGALLAVGHTAFDAAMTSDVYDTLNCILYCNMNNDGSFTDAQISAIKLAINTQLSGVAATFLHDNVGILGRVGMTNAARTASTRTFDCSGCDCPWCYTFDFSSSDGGWELSADGFGEYVSGEGWRSNFNVGTDSNGYRAVLIKKDFAATITEFTISVDMDSQGTPAYPNWIYVHDTIGTLLLEGATPGTVQNYQFTWDGMHSITSIDAVQASSGFGSGGFDPGGQVTIKTITIKGIGTNPFGDDNCM